MVKRVQSPGFGRFFVMGDYLFDKSLTFFPFTP